MKKKGKIKVVASIEARMLSSRLPGKVLMSAAGRPLLQYMIERVRRASKVDDVVVATTVNPADEPIVDLCQKIGVKVYRGSEEDVLQRVLDAHAFMGSDIIVELTGDCPLIDPELIDSAVAQYLEGDFDYVSNAHVRSYPDGFDVQVFSLDLLREVSRKTNNKADREHVSLHIYKSGEYSLKAIIAPEELALPELRVTLDNIGDYRLIKNIVEAFAGKSASYGVRQVVEYIRQNPALLELQKGAVYHEVDGQRVYRKDEI